MTDTSERSSSAWSILPAAAVLLAIAAIRPAWNADELYPVLGGLALVLCTLFIREAAIDTARRADPHPWATAVAVAGAVGLLMFTIDVGFSELHLLRRDAVITHAIVLGCIFMLTAGYFVRAHQRLDATHVFSWFPVTDSIAAPLAGLFVFCAFASGLFDALDVQSKMKLALLLTVLFAPVLAVGAFLLPAVGLHLRADPRRRFLAFVIESLLPVTVILAACVSIAFQVREWAGAAGGADGWPLHGVVGLGWAIAAPAIAAALPPWALARYDIRGGRRHSEDPLNAAAYRRHITRTYLVSSVLLREHAAVFLVNLPLSMALSLVPLFGLPDNVPPFAVVSAWITASLAWTSVLLHRLYFIEDTFARAYAADLHRVVTAQRRQLVILGYGDIGRRFLYEQFNKDVLLFKSLADHVDASSDIVMPSGRIGKVFTRVIVVEQGDPRAKGALLSPDGLYLTTRDVSSALRDNADVGPKRRPVPYVDYVVPTIVGDPSDTRILQGAGFDDAAFIVCAVEEGDGSPAAQAVMQRLKDLTVRHRRIPAVMTVHTSMLAPYITQRVIDHDLELHYIFPEHLEGLNAANVLHAAVLKLREPAGRWPRIAICGHGKRAFYLVDSFLKNLSKSEFDDLAGAQLQDVRIVLIGRGSEGEGAATEPAALANTAFVTQLRERGLSMLELPFTRLVGRTPDGDAGWQPFGADPLYVPQLKQDPQELSLWRKLLESYWPDVVLFADPNSENELRAMHALVNTIARNRPKPEERRLPLVILSGETGRRYEMRQFESALVYYSSLHAAEPRPLPAHSSMFPAPALEREPEDGRFLGDCLVDVLDDPVQRLSAVLRAYCPNGPGWPVRADRVPLEMSVCVADQASVLAVALARLSGLQPGQMRYPDERYPWLSNAKVMRLPDNGFIVRSFAYLSTGAPASDPRFLRLAVSGSTDWGTPDHPRPLNKQALVDVEQLFAGGSPGGESVKARNTLLDVAEPDFTRAFQAYAVDAGRHIARCCGMANCPIEAVHKVAASSAQTVAASMIRAGALRTGHGKALLRHFTFDDGVTSERTDMTRAPFGTIRLRCAGGAEPGTLASAVNALLFRALEEPAVAPARVYNATYVSAYECHDERYAVFTCYGALENRRNGGAPPDFSRVIEEIEIKPVRDLAAWQQYAKKLCEFLGNGFVQEPQPEDLLGHRLVIRRTGAL